MIHIQPHEPISSRFGGLRQCRNKRPFERVRDATAVACRRAKYTDRQLKCYKCEVCGCWHIAKARPEDEPIYQWELEQ